SSEANSRASEAGGTLIKYRFGLNALVVLGLVISTYGVSAQENKPAVEYQSLLNMKYYEANGGFLGDDLQLVFPSQGNQKLSFVITRKTGEESARVPLRSEGVRTFDAFRVLRPDRVPGVVRLGQPGDFVMAVKIGDQAITTLPFSLKEEKSTDPYNPKKTYVREGPWR